MFLTYSISACTEPHFARWTVVLSKERIVGFWLRVPSRYSAQTIQLFIRYACWAAKWSSQIVLTEYSMQFGLSAYGEYCTVVNFVCGRNRLLAHLRDLTRCSFNCTYKTFNTGWEMREWRVLRQLHSSCENVVNPIKLRILDNCFKWMVNKRIIFCWNQVHRMQHQFSNIRHLSFASIGLT